MTSVKALSVLQTMDLVQRKHGDEVVERVKRAISPEARRRMYESPLVPNDWVDIRHVVENLVVYDRLVGRGDGRAGQALVRELAVAQMHGIYRVLFALSSPRMLIEKSSRLWPRYYDRGATIGEVHEDGFATVRIVGCNDLPLHHDWLILPFSEEALIRAGAKGAVGEHVQCVARGAEFCVSAFRWK